MVFNSLREDFKFASKKCQESGLLTEEEKHKYFMSGMYFVPLTFSHSRDKFQLTMYVHNFRTQFRKASIESVYKYNPFENNKFQNFRYFQI